MIDRPQPLEGVNLYALFDVYPKGISGLMIMYMQNATIGFFVTSLAMLGCAPEPAPPIAPTTPAVVSSAPTQPTATNEPTPTTTPSTSSSKASGNNTFGGTLGEQPW